ncbi:MAG: hypothetical protein WC683_01905 [bacterium]
MTTMKAVFEAISREKVVPNEVFAALKPYVKRMKKEIRAWNMGDPGDVSDKELIQSAWEGMRLAGWMPEDVLAQPSRAVDDVLGIWRSN